MPAVAGWRGGDAGERSGRGHKARTSWPSSVPWSPITPLFRSRRAAGWVSGQKKFG